MAKYRMPAAPQQLRDEAQRLRTRTLRQMLADDPQRVARLSREWNGWRADFSKERISPAALDALVAHAHSLNLPQWIEALFQGEKLNLSEAQPALHTVLRQQDDAPVHVDGRDVIPLVRAVQARMRTLSDAVRTGTRRGATGRRFRHVVNLGIGGSDLGSRLVCDALAPLRAAGAEEITVSFVSNVDPEHLSRALAPVAPESTLFIVTSKTFGTQETLANAHSARAWLQRGLPRAAPLAPHFVGVSANVDAAVAFGIAADDVLPVWNWVGGRFSLWSAVGLPIALALGYPRFEELLAGAARMDEHFRTAPLADNLPVIAALHDYWNAGVLGHSQRIVIPYAQALAALPAYLQQLSLESNGKSVTRAGDSVDGPTAPALWGAVGTDGQHAFFQWLHQGTREVPVEFVLPVRAAHPLGDQQLLLVANALAQAQALLAGRGDDDVRPALAAKGLSGAALDAAVAARRSPGNRASTMLLLPSLDARELGSLLAHYEHRTFVEGVLYGVNSFDQWGVELGKSLALPLQGALAGNDPLPAASDPSTRALLAHAQRLLRGP